MTATAPPPPAVRRPRARVLAGGVAVAALVAAGTVTLTSRGGDDGGDTAGAPAVFTASTRQVTYEVSGPGKVEEIVYVVGAGNKLEHVPAPKLPWRKEITLDVGEAGGTALVNAAISGAEPLHCKVFVDGKLVFTADGQEYSDVSCSTAIAPATAD